MIIINGQWSMVLLRRPHVFLACLVQEYAISEPGPEAFEPPKIGRLVVVEPTHLKHMLVKLDHETPFFGVKIPKIFELPPPSGWLGLWGLWTPKIGPLGDTGSQCRIARLPASFFGKMPPTNKHNPYHLCTVYIYTYIWVMFMRNVGKQTLYGWY